MKKSKLEKRLDKIDVRRLKKKINFFRFSQLVTALGGSCVVALGLIGSQLGLDLFGLISKVDLIPQKAFNVFTLLGLGGFILLNSVTFALDTFRLLVSDIVELGDKIKLAKEEIKRKSK